VKKRNSLLANALATASRRSTAARARSRILGERILVCALSSQLSGDDATAALLGLSPRSPAGPRFQLRNMVDSLHFANFVLEPVSIRATSPISVPIAKLAIVDELLF